MIILDLSMGCYNRLNQMYKYLDPIIQKSQNTTPNQKHGVQDTPAHNLIRSATPLDH
jgi:hypothetical protein